MPTGQKGLETSMGRAAYQCVVDPSIDYLRGRKAYVTMDADGCGTCTWWSYEERQRDA